MPCVYLYHYVYVFIICMYVHIMYIYSIVYVLCLFVRTWVLGITRAEQDAMAVNSHRKAATAQASGRYTENIVLYDYTHPPAHTHL